VNFPPSLVDELDVLSAALHDGGDLTAILSVLMDDLAAAVPAFLGVELRLIAEPPVVVSTLSRADTGRVKASVQLPLDLMGLAPAGSALVCYAAAPGAFTDLALATRKQYHLDGQVRLDSQFVPLVSADVLGVADRVTTEQAIGVLIEQGHTPDEARAALQRRATRDGVALVDAARSVIAAVLPDGT
jgi:hypothetical protein